MEYDFKTTFWSDFSIAEKFGESAIRDTYKRAFWEWKNNAEYVTELVLVLNWKIWALYKTNEPIARVYNELWAKTNDWCFDNLKGEDLDYFISTTD